MVSLALSLFHHSKSFAAEPGIEETENYLTQNISFAQPSETGGLLSLSGRAERCSLLWTAYYSPLSAFRTIAVRVPVKELDLTRTKADAKTLSITLKNKEISEEIVWFNGRTSTKKMTTTHLTFDDDTRSRRFAKGVLRYAKLCGAAEKPDPFD